MKLDDGETLEIEIKPDEKILVMWFLTKTITYSLATMFFVFMAMFFINTFNLASEVEALEKVKTEISQDSKTKEQIKEKIKKKMENPFKVFVEYWKWALVVAGIAAVLIQIYLIYLRKTYRYIITNRRCIFVGGILKRIERTVPYKKITDIQRTQNIIERLLGIWNVQVFTPGTASMQIGQAKARAELNYDGLINSEELYEIVNKHTQING